MTAINSAAQHLGRIGGLARSDAKREASKTNGKTGGRPRINKARVAVASERLATDNDGIGPAIKTGGGKPSYDHVVSAHRTLSAKAEALALAVAHALTCENEKLSYHHLEKALEEYGNGEG